MPPMILKSQPGIKRDGTQFDGDFYTDGQWVRFQRGLPRKMGGYRAVQTVLSDASRGFSGFTSGENVVCHSGISDTLERFFIDENYNSSTVSDRTPTTLVDSVSNKWQFQYMYDSSSTANSIIAFVAPNLSSVSNTDGGQIFIGDATGVAPLTEIAVPAGLDVSGGIVVLHPYLFFFGTGGVIGWSVAGEPTDLTTTADGAGLARPWGQKIIRGLSLRSTGGPAGLFIAEDAVIRAVFNGGATVFDFDVIATNTSIMSPESVVDVDGVIFWAGVDRFLMFNGVVKEVPNNLNLNFFFDNIKTENRSKVFSFRVPKYGEIWWCFPKGNSEECDHAVIFNHRENTWYDTAIPIRTAGVYSNGTGNPLLIDDSGVLWVHEKGKNKINGQVLDPINSYFETADLSSIVQGQDGSLRIVRIEPDFLQEGPMTVQVKGRANARASEIIGDLIEFPDSATIPYEEVVVLKEQRRELRVKFASDAINGDYQMGQIVAHFEKGDERYL